MSRELKVPRLCLLLSGDVDPGRLGNLKHKTSHRRFSTSLIFHVGDKPTLQELSCFTYTINGREKKVCIIDAVAARWKRLGIALEFEKYQLDNIRENHRSVEKCSQELLSQWLEGASNVTKPAVTWKKLLHAMKEARCLTVAQVLQLQKALSGEGKCSQYIGHAFTST